MPSNKRFLAPGFLNRIDQWLLLNKPETWSARAHLVLYYGGAFIVILALLAYMFPDDPRTASGVFNWALFTSMITIIALVVWLIYLLRFNVFKRYGITSSWHRLKAFLLYFFSVGIILLISFTQSSVESYKANKAFDDDEIINDLNSINKLIVQLEYDSLQHVWRRDTFRIVDTIPGRRYAPPSPPDYEADVVTVDTDITTPVAYSLGTKLMDTTTLRVRLENGDSTVLINDSTYIFLECPQYIFVNLYGIEGYSTVEKYDSDDVYRAVVQNYVKPDAAKVSAQLKLLMEKYKDPQYWYSYSSDYNNYLASIQRRYSINEVESGLRHIAHRKNMWRGSGLEIIFRVFFYIALSLSLLVFIFRHTTVKTFFLTLLAACIISILTGLFIALSDLRFSGFLLSLMFYFIVFTTMAVMTWKARIRSVAIGIAVNLLVFLLPFIPLIVVAYPYALKDESLISYARPDNRHVWFFAAEIIGPLLLLVAIPTFIHRVYRKWFALPEE